MRGHHALFVDGGDFFIIGRPGYPGNRGLWQRQHIVRSFGADIEQGGTFDRHAFRQTDHMDRQGHRLFRIADRCHGHDSLTGSLSQQHASRINGHDSDIIACKGDIVIAFKRH